MSDNYTEFSKQTVAIPLIQRDYVQGADRNAVKRNSFLENLFEALRTDTTLELDFIYGSSEKDNGTTKSFIPIDGQQRLTTLALLGWILNHRAGYKYTSELPRVTYMTRPSSEQFCKHLLAYKLPESYESISTYITTVPGWFSNRWQADPTINAMLQMLDKMDSMLNLYEKQYGNDTIQRMAHTFFHSSPFTFEHLDMHALELDDELYIKMNARGKLLTPFENWKAGFIALLNDKFSSEPYPYKMIPGIENPTLPEYFEYAIEHDWCDLLWPLALSQWKALDDEERRKASYPRIDESFMNLLTYVARFLFFSQRKSTAQEEETRLRQLFDNDTDRSITSVFSNKDNVIILFRLLDLFVKLKDAWPNDKGGCNLLDAYFNELFTGKFDVNDHRLNIYQSKTNLFMQCLNGDADGLTVSMEVVFWSVLVYLLHHPACISHPDGAMIDYLRIILGWVRGKRQRLVKGLSVQPNVRLSDYREANNIIDLLSTSDDPFATLASTKSSSLEAERRKAIYHDKPQFEIIKALSNCDDLYFSFNLLYPSIDTSTNAKAYIQRFMNFYKMGDEDRILALVLHGFTGICTMNGHYFYGQRQSDNNHWPYIFTTDKTDGGFDDSVRAFTSWMNGEPELQLDSNQFAYYLCKYPDFLNAVYEGTPKHYFICSDNWFNVWAVKTFSSRPIMGYNVDPYALTVLKLYNNRHSDDVNLYMETFSYYSDHGLLYIRGINSKNWAIQMECCQKGWEITCLNNTRCVQNLINRYGDARKTGKYKDVKGYFSFSGNILFDLKGKDHIETALAFLETLE
mgnify:CR=1 FL=1